VPWLGGWVWLAVPDASRARRVTAQRQAGSPETTPSIIGAAEGEHGDVPTPPSAAGSNARRPESQTTAAAAAAAASHPPQPQHLLSSCGTAPAPAAAAAAVPQQPNQSVQHRRRQQPPAVAAAAQHSASGVAGSSGGVGLGPSLEPEEFASYDVDGSGYIEYGEFAQLVRERGWIYELSEQELQLAWQRIDDDGDGTISYSELNVWWRRGPGARYRDLQCTEGEKGQLKWAADRFRAHDADGCVQRFFANLSFALTQLL
jgi:hypothetical protein